jgi:hypothetical protein
MNRELGNSSALLEIQDISDAELNRQFNKKITEEYFKQRVEDSEKQKPESEAAQKKVRTLRENSFTKTKGAESPFRFS